MIYWRFQYLSLYLDRFCLFMNQCIEKSDDWSESGITIQKKSEKSFLLGRQLELINFIMHIVRIMIRTKLVIVIKDVIRFRC